MAERGCPCCGDRDERFLTFTSSSDHCAIDSSWPCYVCVICTYCCRKGNERRVHYHYYSNSEGPTLRSEEEADKRKMF